MGNECDSEEIPCHQATTKTHLGCSQLELNRTRTHTGGGIYLYFRCDWADHILFLDMDMVWRSVRNICMPTSKFSHLLETMQNCNHTIH